jgi:acyl-CoA thioesterase FadM
MSSIVTKWVVLRHHDVSADDLDAAGVLRDDVVVCWVEASRDAYLDCCPVLRDTAAATGYTVRCDLGSMPAGTEFDGVSSVSVSAGTTEFWPDAFTLAVRIRGYGAADDTACNVECRVSLADPETGESCDLGDDVRDELIALAHAAQHYN